MTDSEFIKNSKITALEMIDKYPSMALYNADIVKLMTDFAEIHVKLALFYASGKAMLSPELHDFIEDSWTDGDKIDKQSILNAYPLENIK